MLFRSNKYHNLFSCLSLLKQSTKIRKKLLIVLLPIFTYSFSFALYGNNSQRFYDDPSFAMNEVKRLLDNHQNQDQIIIDPEVSPWTKTVIIGISLPVSLVACTNLFAFMAGGGEEALKNTLLGTGAITGVGVMFMDAFQGTLTGLSKPNLSKKQEQEQGHKIIREKVENIAQKKPLQPLLEENTSSDPEANTYPKQQSLRSKVLYLVMPAAKATLSVYGCLQDALNSQAGVWNLTQNLPASIALGLGNLAAESFLYYTGLSALSSLYVKMWDQVQNGTLSEKKFAKWAIVAQSLSRFMDQGQGSGQVTKPTTEIIDEVEKLSETPSEWAEFMGFYKQYILNNIELKTLAENKDKGSRIKGGAKLAIYTSLFGYIALNLTLGMSAPTVFGSAFVSELTGGALAANVTAATTVVPTAVTSIATSTVAVTSTMLSPLATFISNIAPVGVGSYIAQSASLVPLVALTLTEILSPIATTGKYLLCDRQKLHHYLQCIRHNCTASNGLYLIQRAIGAGCYLAIYNGVAEKAAKLHNLSKVANVPWYVWAYGIQPTKNLMAHSSIALAGVLLQSSSSVRKIGQRIKSTYRQFKGGKVEKRRKRTPKQSKIVTQQKTRV